MAYDLTSLHLPVLYGTGLKLFTAAVENSLIRPILIGSLLKSGGVYKLREAKLTEPPTYYPVKFTAGATAYQHPDVAEVHAANHPDTPYATIRQYAAAYRSGAADPVAVAEKLLAFIEASDRLDPPMRFFIHTDREDLLAQARESARRIQEGNPRSLFEGVPVAIKDEFDMRGHPTTIGTAFYGSHPVSADAAVVARLREAGALLVGKAHMHEIGINPDGTNPIHGRCCNPWNPAHDTGGSSSGPAAVVAAGISPVSIGADGGGSIRVPAAHCGVVGLKPTFGRVSEHGAAPTNWSVAHIGPIGATVEDVALAYAVIAGQDETEPNTLHQPPVIVNGWQDADLSGLRLGVYWEHFRHADAEVVALNEAMLARLVDAGAAVVDIEIPDLDLMRIAHAMTILSEMAVFQRDQWEHRKEFSPGTRLSLTLGQVATSHDILQAQRVRTRAMRIFDGIYQQVDAIISPTTALPAPAIPQEANSAGQSNLSLTTEMMRFVFAANLCGNPAISFPAGFTAGGLPVGMQAMGKHWEEHLLLKIAFAAEQVMEHRQPAVFCPVL